MLAAALKAEADAYINRFLGEFDAEGHRLVVRTGYAEPRTVMCAAAPQR